MTETKELPKPPETGWLFVAHELPKVGETYYVQLGGKSQCKQVIKARVHLWGADDILGDVVFAKLNWEWRNGGEYVSRQVRKDDQYLAAQQHDGATESVFESEMLEEIKNLKQELAALQKDKLYVETMCDEISRQRDDAQAVVRRYEARLNDDTRLAPIIAGFLSMTQYESLKESIALGEDVNATTLHHLLTNVSAVCKDRDRLKELLNKHEKRSDNTLLTRIEKLSQELVNARTSELFYQQSAKELEEANINLKRELGHLEYLEHLAQNKIKLLNEKLKADAKRNDDQLRRSKPTIWPPQDYNGMRRVFWEEMDFITDALHKGGFSSLLRTLRDLAAERQVRKDPFKQEPGRHV